MWYKYLYPSLKSMEWQGRLNRLLESEWIKTLTKQELGTFVRIIRHPFINRNKKFDPVALDKIIADGKVLVIRWSLLVPMNYHMFHMEKKDWQFIRRMTKYDAREIICNTSEKWKNFVIKIEARYVPEPPRRHWHKKKQPEDEFLASIGF